MPRSANSRDAWAAAGPLKIQDVLDGVPNSQLILNTYIVTCSGIMC